MVNLTDKNEEVKVQITKEFLDYLSKGNRTLFLFKDIRQANSLIYQAFENNISFEFDRVKSGVLITVFKRLVEVKVFDEEPTSRITI